tara:strand:+ start:3261 stop:3542 length:282 start_codon:yes stop_codon:yes gene_type:complete
MKLKWILENEKKPKLYVQPVTLIYRGVTTKRTKLNRYTFEDGFEIDTRRLSQLGLKGINGAIKRWNLRNNKSLTQSDFEVKELDPIQEYDVRY